MAETGIEDFTRDPGKGCASNLIAEAVFVLILIVAFVLISYYCSPKPETNSNPTENAR